MGVEAEARPEDGGGANAAAAAAASDAGEATRAALIQRGSHVILRDSEGAQKVFRITAGCKDLRMGRYPPLPVESVLGAPYGATLGRSESGVWERRGRHVRHLDAAAAPGDACEDGEVYEHNANLPQDNTAQALSSAEVKELKGRCSGENVVKELANNSATFASKTKFAQEKYLRKKSAKHVQQVTLLRPTVMELCETYMKQSRGKVCGLRFDYLSSLLCQADVRSGGRYFVLDSANGLVVAAIAQQLGGLGQVYRAYRGGCSDKALQELDLGSRRDTVHALPLEVLQTREPWSHGWFKPPAEGETPGSVEEAGVLAAYVGLMGRAALDRQVVPSVEQARFASRKERCEQRRAELRDLKARPVDGVIIVASEEESELAAEALEVGLALIGSGGRVVVFSQHLQPLAARQGAFRASGGFVDVRLHQLFTREYQVLPMRTHPVMTAEAMLCEGFVLSATKVIDDGGDEEDAAASGPPPKRRRRG